MQHVRHVGATALAILVAWACGNEVAPKRPATPGDVTRPGTTGVEPAVSALQERLAAMEPTATTPPSDEQRRLVAATETYLSRNATERHYLHVDKPLYQPGETIWLRAWELSTRSLTQSGSPGVRIELVAPDGSTVIDKRVQSVHGVLANDFELPATLQGGEYELRVTPNGGEKFERSVIVSTYQPPRIKKKAVFLRKAYGPGDTVRAAVSAHRATGEPLGNKKLTALVVIDGVEIARTPVQTDSEGKAVVQFDLPERMRRGDGLLTVLVDEGGVTESLQKRIPITLEKVSFETFPEGGRLVAGLPGSIPFTTGWAGSTSRPRRERSISSRSRSRAASTRSSPLILRWTAAV